MSGAPRLILASASPRRRELLGRLGVAFTVDPAEIPEELPAQAPRAERVARRLARAKALAVAARYPGLPVLAADTVVVFRGRLLGKPADETEARAMLLELRGRWHRVITAVAVARHRRVRVDHAVTLVRMREYSDEEIASSIARGDPFDKAGAYAIQDGCFRPVAEYLGCYCNVVGLPLALVVKLLDRAGIAVSVSMKQLLPECAHCPLFARWRNGDSSGGGL